MIRRSLNLSGLGRAAKTTILLTVVFFFASALPAAAQKKYASSFPAGQNVRLRLMNRSGTVTVEGWNRPEVRITATLEAPAALIVPQNVNGTIDVNIVRDNHGRDQVGNVNFNVRVPYDSNVDIETRIGNLNVSNVRGGLVRARISAEGDITLANIGAGVVAAENVIGDIFFDGELQLNGSYRFSSNTGNISLRIPFNSSFRLMATAPSTRSISLGALGSGSLSYVGDGRRVVGRFGSGSATLTVTNQRGEIKFIPR